MTQETIGLLILAATAIATVVVFVCTIRGWIKEYLASIREARTFEPEPNYQPAHFPDDEELGL
jgi:hypothetical protein